MHPIIFKLGPLNIFSYGAMLSLGVIIAAYFIQRRAVARGMDADKVMDLIFWIIVSGIIGGRVLFVMLNLPDYLSAPMEIFKLYKGGLVFHGGLIAGLSTALYLIRKYKLPLFALLDIFAVYLPLGHAFGRIGCFLNGCCFGRPTQAAWGVVFPGLGVKVHPTQVYSALILAAIFAVLLTVEKNKKFDGQVLAFYLMLYGAARFMVEFLRGDNPILGVGLTLFQIISLILFLCGIIIYFRLCRGKGGLKRG